MTISSEAVDPALIARIRNATSLEELRDVALTELVDAQAAEIARLRTPDPRLERLLAAGRAMGAVHDLFDLPSLHIELSAALDAYNGGEPK
jgi:hypothetical protein